MTPVARATRAIVFDAYGTLFDVHSVIARCGSIFPGQGSALSRLWRSKQLEYTWLRTLMQRYESFDVITASALQFACEALGLAWTQSTRDALLDEYLRLRPYPEACGALAELSDHRRAILSNGSPAMLEPLVAHNGMAQYFDAVLSVDPLRVYKPDPRVYQSAVDRLGVEPSQIAFVSSNFWDISGASHFGFRTFWINRGGAGPDYLGAHPTAILHSLEELRTLL